MKYEEKFIVINKKYLQNRPLEWQNKFADMLNQIQSPDHNYLVVNTDEPYADLVFRIIELGEDLKMLKG